MNPRILGRRTAAVLLALALAAGGAVLVAPAASASNAPKVTITSGPTVTGTSVSVGFAVNRQTKSVALCTYTLDGGATNTSCGAPTSAPKVNPATYSVTATNLTGGTYTLTVKVKLTDSGTASASSTPFTIVPPVVFPLSAYDACTAAGGTFTSYDSRAFLIWSCEGPAEAIRLSADYGGALRFYCEQAFSEGIVYGQTSPYIFATAKCVAGQVDPPPSF